MSQFDTPHQPPAARQSRKWIWMILLGGLGLGILLCSALTAILLVPKLFPSLEPTPIPPPTPLATATEIIPTPTSAPTLTPTPNPTSTPRPTSTPIPTSRPTSTKVPAQPPPAAPPAPASTQPAAPSGGSGTIYLESYTTSNATCRISVWGMGDDFLMDAGPGYPASRQVTPGEYGWQAFFGPSGQTGGLSMNVPAGGSCTVICYDTYVDYGCSR